VKTQKETKQSTGESSVSPALEKGIEQAIALEALQEAEVVDMFSNLKSFALNKETTEQTTDG
jgi:hypothetical protein